MRMLAAAFLLGMAAYGQPVAIQDVRLFDGEKVTARTIVVFEGGRIVSVGAPAPQGAKTIDGAGKTLLPGFIDAHTHTVQADALKQAPIFGVTTTLDMFTSPDLARTLRKPAAGASTFLSSGFLATVPKGHGTEYGLPVPTLTKPEEAQAWVDARIAEGSDYIKIIYDDGSPYGTTLPTLDAPTVRALVAAAHARGKLAVVHVGTLAEAESAIEAGADGLMHLFTGGPTEPNLGKLAASHKVFVVPTLSVLCGNEFNARLADDADLKPYLNETERAGMKKTFPFPMKCDGTWEAMKQLRAAGVPILTGSDALNPGTSQGATIQGELELLVKSGLTPIEALRAATSNAARAFKLNDRGMVAPGQRADLVLVDGDPTVDIRATRKIATVWLNGLEVDRSAWRAHVEKEAADAAKRRSAPAPAGSESGLISDFEGGKVEAKFGAGWMVSTDSMMQGKSEAKLEVVDGAMLVSGEVKAGFAFPWAGAMFSPGKTPMAPANLSSKKSVTFRAKGDGKTYRLMLFASKLGFQPAMKTFTAGSDWKQYRFTFDSFGVDGSDLMALVWCGGPAPGKFELLLDEVRVE